MGNCAHPKTAALQLPHALIHLHDVSTETRIALMGSLADSKVHLGSVESHTYTLLWGGQRRQDINHFL